MKKTQLLSSLFLLVCLCSQGFAQQRRRPQIKSLSPLYFRVYGSFTLFSPSSFRGEGSLVESLSKPLNNLTFETGTKSVADGGRAGLGFGYILNDNISIGLDAEFLFNPLIKEQVKEIKTPIAQSDDYTKSYDLRMLSINPHVVFRAISTDDFTLYNRLGICLGVPMLFEITENGKRQFRTTTSTIFGDAFKRSSITTPLGLGYMAALGGNLKLSRHLSAYLEIYTSQITLRPTKYTITTFTINGSNAQEDVAAKYNPRILVNSLGLSAGVQYRF